MQVFEDSDLQGDLAMLHIAPVTSNRSNVSDSLSSQYTDRNLSAGSNTARRAYVIVYFTSRVPLKRDLTTFQSSNFSRHRRRNGSMTSLNQMSSPMIGSSPTVSTSRPIVGKPRYAHTRSRSIKRPQPRVSKSLRCPTDFVLISF